MSVLWRDRDKDTDVDVCLRDTQERVINAAADDVFLLGPLLLLWITIGICCLVTFFFSSLLLLSLLPLDQRREQGLTCLLSLHTRVKEKEREQKRAAQPH